jgi:hypothetical protein
MARNYWSFEETSIAFLLYLTIPRKDCDDKNIRFRNMAKAIKRSPSSVALKI